MKLTDADLVEIRSVLREELGFDQIMEVDKQLYLAGKRAGREDMRERAAKACDSWAGCNEGYTVPDFMCGTEARSCAAAIRALGVDDD